MDAVLGFLGDLSARIFKARVNFQNTPSERINQVFIQCRLESLDLLWADFRQAHKELILKFDTKVLQKECYFTDEIYDKTEMEFTDYKCELKGRLDVLQSSNTDQPTINIEVTNARSNLVKLPKITIPIFTGKYTEWITFRDLFMSLIHNNDSFDNVQKMQYLKGYLSGEAEQLIRNIPVSDINYARSWSLLENRYNNKKYLSYSILKRLLGQKNATSESSVFLKELMDTSADCLSALSNLDIDVSTWDVILVYLLTLKLDPESRKQWELKTVTKSSSDELPSFDEFQEFLSSRYRALEFIEPQVNHRSPAAYMKQPDSYCHNQKVLHVTNAPTLACEYCTALHKLCFCKKFANEDYDTRREFVTSNRICYNCLGSNHSVGFCQKPTRCRICKRRHHSLLHPKDTPTATVNQENIGQAIGCRSVEKIGNSLKDIVHEEILLPTALVKVKSPTGDAQTVRAILDQGSQASFVTEAVVQSLGLKKIPTRGTLSGLACKKTSVMSSHTVELNVQSLTDPTFNFVLNAYVLKEITNNLPDNKIEVSTWKDLMLQQFKLADPNYGTPGKVDALFGANIYSQILKDGVIKGSQGTPLAQCTNLGWILSGPVSIKRPSV